MTADRDPAVGALLDHLPVDPPSQAFWDDLRTALANPDARVVGLDPIAPRSRRRIAAAVLAAAAVIGAAVFMGSSLGDDGKDDLRVQDPPAPSVTDPEAVTPTTIADVLAEVERAVATARTFLFAEDSDEVWELLGPQSRESLGGQLNDETRGYISANREDVHLLRAAPDLRITGVVVAQHSGVTTSIATLRGTSPSIEDDGSMHSWNWPLMVQEDADGNVWVEQFLPGQSIELVELPASGPAGSVLLPGDTVTVNGEPDQLGLVVLVDGEPVPDSAYVLDAAQTVVGVRLSRDLEAGEHQIVVGMVTADGTLALGIYSFLISTG